MAESASSRRYVAYFRVSTPRQGASGLGLQAQQQAVQNFLSQHGGKLLASFTEVRTGKNESRPQLAEALRLCRLSNAILLIAKLDRLSRNAAFLLTLQNSSTRFVACDTPDMNEATIGILAVIAETERKAIAERTRVALAAARARGVRLGNPALLPGNRHKALVASQAAASKAAHRAHELSEIIAEARRGGCTSLRSVATYLNDLGIATPRGSKWHASGVRNVLLQIFKQNQEIKPESDSGCNRSPHSHARSAWCWKKHACLASSRFAAADDGSRIPGSCRDRISEWRRFQRR